MSPAIDTGYTLAENSDGSAVLTLSKPLQLGSETLTRLTIPRLTGRHMRAASWPINESPTLGALMSWAADVVQPAGALDELDAVTARNVAGEVAISLGKSRAIGALPSSA